MYRNLTSLANGLILWSLFHPIPQLSSCPQLRFAQSALQLSLPARTVSTASSDASAATASATALTGAMRKTAVSVTPEPETD